MKTIALICRLLAITAGNLLLVWKVIEMNQIPAPLTFAALMGMAWSLQVVGIVTRFRLSVLREQAQRMAELSLLPVQEAMEAALSDPVVGHLIRQCVAEISAAEDLEFPEDES